MTDKSVTVRVKADNVLGYEDITVFLDESYGARPGMGKYLYILVSETKPMKGFNCNTLLWDEITQDDLPPPPPPPDPGEPCD